MTIADDKIRSIRRLVHEYQCHGNPNRFQNDIVAVVDGTDSDPPPDPMVEAKDWRARAMAQYHRRHEKDWHESFRRTMDEDMAALADEAVRNWGDRKAEQDREVLRIELDKTAQWASTVVEQRDKALRDLAAMTERAEKAEKCNLGLASDDLDAIGAKLDIEAERDRLRIALDEVCRRVGGLRNGGGEEEALSKPRSWIVYAGFSDNEPSTQRVTDAYCDGSDTVTEVCVYAYKGEAMARFQDVRRVRITEEPVKPTAKKAKKAQRG